MGLADIPTREDLQRDDGMFSRYARGKRCPGCNCLEGSPHTGGCPMFPVNPIEAPVFSDRANFIGGVLIAAIEKGESGRAKLATQDDLDKVVHTVETLLPL